MNVFVAGLMLVPLLDQGVKRLVLARLSGRSISLGLAGEVRVVQTQIWLLRTSHRISLAALWLLWATGAGVSAAVTVVVPEMGWALGLLVGSALSHAVETSVRGFICDYVCLRFWPAFDMADVALTAGAVGLLVELVPALL